MRFYASATSDVPLSQDDIPLPVLTIICNNCCQVVANAVAALSEINEASPSGQPLVEMNAQTINKLLTALNECTEWGQVFILDSLANYSPKDDREAQSICERITPRLAHANAAVVLSAVKVSIS